MSTGAGPRELGRAPRVAKGGAGRPELGPAPVALVVPALLAFGFLALPLVAVLLRAPWRTLVSDAGGSLVRQALWLSLWTSTVAALVCLVLGVPMAWVLARSGIRGRSFLRAAITLPLVLPPVVGGIALLLAFGRTGVLGRYLDAWFGVTLPFTSTAVIMAQAFVALPFLVLSVEGTLRASNPRFDQVAATLGASRWTTFRYVTLPLVWPGVVSGLVLSWARALGEFGATATFAGNYPGTTRTMPLQIYLAYQAEPDAAIALSVIMIAVSLLVLVSLRDRWLAGVAA
jgi:molybdate transport system permease protein